MFQKNVDCKPLKKLSSWRQISLATWERPQDPSVYAHLEINTSKLLELLENLNKSPGQKITITHLIIKAMAKVLEKYPEVNVLIRRGRLYQRDHVDCFVQVFVEEPGGKADLSGAKVRNAHQKSLAQISAELTGQAKRIRKGEDPNLKNTKHFLKILSPRFLKWAMKFLEFLNYDLNISPRIFNMPPDPFGAVMITNVGMFGLKMNWAPLVPFSRSPIVLTVGEITKQPVAENDQVVIKPILNIGVTIDHRIIDGYLGGLAAKTFKNFLENPEGLLP